MNLLIESKDIPEKNIAIHLYSDDGFYFVKTMLKGETVYLNRHLYLEPAQNDLRAQYYSYLK
jgi:hypothetical protein